MQIPRIGAAEAWRDAARGFLQQNIPPEALIWGGAETAPDLFGGGSVRGAARQVSVPRSFLALAGSVVWHTDPARFARLYAFLWRLRDTPHLMTDRGDPDLATLRRMEKNVHRCQHKMKAFVRFREIGDPKAARRSFAAWFEPTHHTVEPTAQFFARRFGDMDWRIYTPGISVLCEGGRLRFLKDCPRPDLPEDASEQLWVTYFQNIFNPARLKVKAMTSEMPKKYWKNMPEAAAIPELIAAAPARARAMAQAAPTLPPARVKQAQAQQARFASSWTQDSAALVAEVNSCTRCPLHCAATQAVHGAGPPDARLMVVGEQPGDLEDLQGLPFVGPAGQLFDAVAREVGLARDAVYVTNAVKHFKYRARGRRRIHQSPDRSEIAACAPWLEEEIRHVSPRLILALGATAAFALTGSAAPLAQRRGRVERRADGVAVLITYHPSYLLRVQDKDKEAAAQARAAFRGDLAQAWERVQPRQLAPRGSPTYTRPQRQPELRTPKL